jgi:hypothetical protein
LIDIIKDKTNKNEKIIEIRGIDNGIHWIIILRKLMEKMDAEILQRAIDIKELKSRENIMKDIRQHTPS